MSEAEQAPPAGESIHIPGGTVLPLTLAIGITMIVVGTTIGLIWEFLGAITFLTSLYLWIRDVRHEIDHMEEHH